jgi:hypothetical protein
MAPGFWGVEPLVLFQEINGPLYDFFHRSNPLGGLILSSARALYPDARQIRQA